MNVQPPSHKEPRPGNLLLTRRKLVKFGIISKDDWIKASIIPTGYRTHAYPFPGPSNLSSSAIHWY